VERYYLKCVNDKHLVCVSENHINIFNANLIKQYQISPHGTLSRFYYPTIAAFYPYLIFREAGYNVLTIVYNLEKGIEESYYLKIPYCQIIGSIDGSKFLILLDSISEINENIGMLICNTIDEFVNIIKKSDMVWESPYDKDANYLWKTSNEIVFQSKISGNFMLVFTF